MHKVHFHAYVTTPGYLPDADYVPTFESTELAWNYLADDVETDWDLAGDSDEPSESYEERFLDVHTQIHGMGGFTGTVHLDGPADQPNHLGVNYSVEECEDGADCEWLDSV